MWWWSKQKSDTSSYICAVSHVAMDDLIAETCWADVIESKPGRLNRSSCGRKMRLATCVSYSFQPRWQVDVYHETRFAGVMMGPQPDWLMLLLLFHKKLSTGWARTLKCLTPVAGLNLLRWKVLIPHAGRRTNFRDKKSSDFSGEIFRERNFGRSITAPTTLFPLIGCGMDSFSPN